MFYFLFIFIVLLYIYIFFLILFILNDVIDSIRDLQGRFEFFPTQSNKLKTRTPSMGIMEIPLLAGQKKKKIQKDQKTSESR